VAKQMESSQPRRAPEGQRPRNAAACTEHELPPALLTGMYCAPHDLELLSEGELARYDGWYVMIENEAQGPLTADDLATRWSRGEIGAETLCCHEVMGEWRPLSRHHNLAVTIAPREWLEALSAARPPVSAKPSDFAPSAPSLLKSLAGGLPLRVRHFLRPAVQRPPTALEGPKRPIRLSSRAKLLFSLFSASVLGAMVGGFMVRMTLSPPPPVVYEPAPKAPAAPPSPVVQPVPPPAPPPTSGVSEI